MVLRASRQHPNINPQSPPPPPPPVPYVPLPESWNKHAPVGEGEGGGEGRTVGVYAHLTPLFILPFSVEEK
ncbi:hypothetical protein E2C01_029739 [Portunus trituberculatus]|uniref:Uncharacterized protein n=1 Tax=Portunus trituberculatus TaxID=210409 RepID=A0A5B7ES99_PORTR|nr:hypothetical protein [Portunus trituberculatus]